MLIAGEPLVELSIDVGKSLDCSTVGIDAVRGGCGAGEAIRDEAIEEDAGDGEEL